MPELPEVQTTVNGLNSKVRGQDIVSVWTDYNSKFHRGKDSIKDPSYFKQFQKMVTGAHIYKIERKAKNILIHIENRGQKSVILVHLKMTGHLLYGRYIHDNGTRGAGTWKPAPGERPSLSDPYNRFVHFVLSLSGGKHLVLCDTRKFAKVTLIPERDMDTSIHLRDIGPDPTTSDFSLDKFLERLNTRPTGRIKNVLMDQSVLAGVGNIYSDEALWRAHIHPEERVKDIPHLSLKKLLPALRAVLLKGIDFGGDSMSDYRNIDGERGAFQEHHRAYQRKGEQCTERGCRGHIVRKVVGGRSAHYCDTHQKLVIK